MAAYLLNNRIFQPDMFLVRAGGWGEFESFLNFWRLYELLQLAFEFVFEVAQHGSKKAVTLLLVLLMKPCVTRGCNSVERQRNDVYAALRSD
jgi:hypothetical protein